MESKRSRSPTVIDDSIDEEQSVGTTSGQYSAVCFSMLCCGIWLVIYWVMCHEPKASENTGYE